MPVPVQVEIPTVFRTYTRGLRSVHASGASLAELLADLDRRYPGVRSRLIADDGVLRRFMNIYVNDDPIRVADPAGIRLADGDVVTIIPAVAGGALTATDQAILDAPWLVIGEHRFQSRLLVGIEQYTSVPEVRHVLEASGCDVFITTADPESGRPSLLLSDLADEITMSDYHWIGTTSFARSVESALKTAHLLRDEYGINVMKLDVRTGGNLPDNGATIRVAEELRAEGMEVLPFIVPSVTTASALESLGCAALRVMAAPVGSGHGISQPDAVSAIIEHTRIPVIVEGGIGTARHAAHAMELGAAGVLVNTAIARAAMPVLMAEAMRDAVRAGLLARRAGPLPGGAVS
jgi:thiazole synthase